MLFQDSLKEQLHFLCRWGFPHTGTHNSCVFWLWRGQILYVLWIVQQPVHWVSFSFLMDTADGLFSKHQWYGTLSVQKYWLFFQKHTSSHKGNKTLLVEQAVPLQYFVQYQSWKLIYCTLQKHSSGQCRYRKA